MKRTISYILLTVLLVAALTVTALAAQPGLASVTDDAGLLTADEVSQLETKADEISEKYQCAVYAVTIDDYRTIDEASVTDAAKALYVQFDLGWGDQQSGVLLLLSMNDRDYALIAYGYGNTAFTDYGKGVLEDEFLDNFGDDDWYGGFSDYIDKSGRMLELARTEVPVDVNSDPDNEASPVVTVVIIVLISAAIAFIVCLILKLTMRSVAKAVSADSYVPDTGVKLTVKTDAYTHTTTVRTPISHDDDSSSGGGTTVGSDGFSSSSGKF